LVAGVRGAQLAGRASLIDCGAFPARLGKHEPFTELIAGVEAALDLPAHRAGTLPRPRVLPPPTHRRTDRQPHPSDPPGRDHRHRRRHRTHHRNQPRRGPPRPPRRNPAPPRHTRVPHAHAVGNPGTPKPCDQYKHDPLPLRVPGHVPHTRAFPTKPPHRQARPHTAPTQTPPKRSHPTCNTAGHTTTHTPTTTAKSHPRP